MTFDLHLYLKKLWSLEFLDPYLDRSVYTFFFNYKSELQIFTLLFMIYVIYNIM